MFKVEIDDRQVQAALTKLQQRNGDMSMAMRAIAMHLESKTQEAFSKQGPGWKALAAATIRKRAKKGQLGQILRVTGALEQSVKSGYGSNYAFAGAGSGKSKAYAAIHQFGGMAGRGRKVKIPARPLLPMTADKNLAPSERDAVLRIIGQHLSQL